MGREREAAVVCEQLPLPEAIRLAEYQSLRNEIKAHIEAINQMEVQTVLASGAVYAFNFTLIQANVFDELIAKMIFFMPVILVAINWHRTRFRQNTIANIALYLQHIEREVFGECLTIPRGSPRRCCGWETYLAIARGERRRLRDRARHPVVALRGLFSLGPVAIVYSGWFWAIHFIGGLAVWLFFVLWFEFPQPGVAV